jgi:hypothetical protein
VTIARISEPAETLLLVDDDLMLRSMQTQLLRQQGYTVLEAESAAEALQLAGVSAPIHLLITDFMMPEVDGLELTHRFRAVYPETPVLMVSGSELFLRARRKPNLSQFDYLAKPFLFDELLGKVRKLLDANTPLPIRRKRCAEH